MLSVSSNVSFKRLSDLQWRRRQRNSRISRQQPPTVTVKRLTMCEHRHIWPERELRSEQNRTRGGSVSTAVSFLSQM